MMQLEVDRFFHGVEMLMDNVGAVTGELPLEATEGVLKGIGDDAEEVVEAGGGGTGTGSGGKGGGKGGKGKKGGKGGEGAEEESTVKPAERTKVPPTVFVSLPLALKKGGEEEEEVIEDKNGKKGKEVEEEVVVKDMLLGAFEAAMAYAGSYGSEGLKLAELEGERRVEECEERSDELKRRVRGAK